VTEKPLLSRRLLQIFNRYLEPGGEEAWVSTLEQSFGLPTCYFNSADWVGADAPPFWSQAVRMIHNPDSLRVLREFQQRANPEAWIVHNAFPIGSAAIYHEAEKNRIPLIQYVHNFRPFSVSGYLRTTDLTKIDSWPQMFLSEIGRASWRNSRLRTAWFAAVLSIAHLLRWFEKVSAWIAVSDFMRDQFIHAGVQRNKIFTLRHFWRPAADVRTNTDNGYYFFIGRLVEMKGILVLLDVWDRIAQENKSTGPKLVIVGDGPLTATVDSRAATNQLVTFRGTVRGSDKIELLRGARAIIAPSLCLESLGLVAYEAYEFSKPVLAARAGGLGEIVVPNQTGLLHEPGDVATLHRQVMILERESQMRIELGRNGRMWLSENADEQKWREEFAEIVEFAIASKR
jgi:glycosyltransferase involved in cell wall biosynthesis